jgi:CO/xanthine dehydrogenase FAD-binding subunit
MLGQSMITAYHRPSSLDEALALLADARRIPLAGGTEVVTAERDREVEVVDLQALGLDRIEPLGNGRVRLGAMARLQDVVDSAAVPGLLRQLATAEQPSTLRTIATVGGAVAGAHGESVFAAGLLAHEAAVALTGGHRRSLADLWADPSVLQGRIILAVEVAADGESSWAATGRTPADTPIVAAIARRAGDTTTVVLTGVGSLPQVVTDVDRLDPPADFRGSAEYRRHLARTLYARATEVLA